MAQGFLGLTVEDQGPAGVAIGGGEVRIEIEGDLEMTHRLIGPALGDGEIAECHVGPGIAVVELGGTMRETRRNLLVAPRKLRRPAAIRAGSSRVRLFRAQVSQG